MADAIHKSTTTQNVALGVTGTGGFFTAIMAWARNTWPDKIPWTPGMDAAIVAGATSIITPIISRAIAFLRHPAKMGIFFLLISAIALQGCAGLTPAIGGKTKLNLHFEDRTDPVMAADGTITSPGETIIWTNKSNLAAGTQVKDAATLSMEAGTKGEWKLGISGDKNSDTQGQADAAAAINAQTLQALSESLSTLTQALVPLATQAIDAKIIGGQIKAGVAGKAIDAVTGRR